MVTMQKEETRERVFVWVGRGQIGHDVGRDGCDFIVQLLTVPK
jgi:hypothetical protein